MNRLLSADVVFWGIVDAESRMIGCSSPALIRCATLDMIAKNHQARIPIFFKDERQIQIFSDALQRLYIKCRDDADQQAIANILRLPPEDIMQHCFQMTHDMLEEARSKVFETKHNRHADILHPQ